MKLIIDASTQGSGGARRHLKEVLYHLINSPDFSVSHIYVWGPKSILSVIPDSSILHKNTSRLLNKGVIGVLIWQIFYRDNCFKLHDYDCIFSPFGNYIGNLRPYVTMSRNMLMFEKDERKKYGFSISRIKFDNL